MKAFRASATGHTPVTESTPRAAADKFFATNPRARKCGVIEGTVDGHFFSIRYGNPWPRSWNDVTKRTASELPAEVTP